MGSTSGWITHLSYRKECFHGIAQRTLYGKTQHTHNTFQEMVKLQKMGIRQGNYACCHKIYLLNLIHHWRDHYNSYFIKVMFLLRILFKTELHFWKRRNCWYFFLTLNIFSSKQWSITITMNSTSLFSS